MVFVVTKYLIIIIACILFASGIMFLRKLNIPTFNNIKINDVFNIFYNSNLWFGLFLNGTAFLLLLYVINVYNDISTIISIQVVYLIIIFFFGIIFMGENFTYFKLLAILFFILGIFILNK